MNVSLPQLDAKTQVKPAGFWLRVVATLIDSMVLNLISAPLMIIFYIVYFSVILNPNNQGSLESMIPIFITMAIIYPIQITLFFLYYGWCYKNKGATLGKMVFKMKVVDVNTGKNIGYGKTFLREFIGKFVCAITFMIGYIIAGARDDKRGLHDMVANTQVLQQIN